jgi:hypothetical protein
MAFAPRQHWFRLALVSSQTVRRLSHASNTQHAASFVQAALAQTLSAEKQMQNLVRASAAKAAPLFTPGRSYRDHGTSQPAH